MQKDAIIIIVDKTLILLHIIGICRVFQAVAEPIKLHISNPVLGTMNGLTMKIVDPFLFFTHFAHYVALPLVSSSEILCNIWYIAENHRRP